MKILQINASYKPAYIYGGPTLSVSRLCEGLVKARNDLEVLTTTANGAIELPVEAGKSIQLDGVTVTYFRRLTKDHTHFSPGLLLKLSQKLKTTKSRKLKAEGEKQKLITQQFNNSTIVHIHAWWNLVSVFSCWIARWKRVPVVLSPRGTLSSYSFANRNGGIKGVIHRWMGKSLLEYCHFHVTSEKEKQDILKLVQPKSITVIPNFVYLPSLDEMMQPNEPVNDSFRLLFLSRIEEKKGLEVLFHALHLIENSTNLRDVSKQLSLTIAGSGDPEYINKLKNLISTLKLQLPIQWLGQAGQKEKWKIMANHNLLVLPSHDENFANVVIECLAVGTPVLISKYVGLSGYVEQRQFGWICDTNAESVALNLLNTMADTKNRELIRFNSPERIRKDFNEEKLIQSYIRLYQTILSDE